MTTREKRLVTTFISAIFILGVLAYASFHLKKLKKLELDLAKVTLQAEISKNAEVIDEKYAAEKKWLKKYEPQDILPSEADIQLEKFVRKSGLGIVRNLTQSMQPLSTQEGHYHENIVNLKAEIDRSQLVGWLKKLHSPKNFRAVTNLKIIPKDNNSNGLICTVTIKKWVLLEENDEY